ncbi:ParB/RepB/Spo0J family partition protein [Acetobacterium woodii]|uniref:ParB-like partition protein n=1 Tax=Acetobacterium woodii (strain ATCC 29683 / DSM 1030 / JCM 2381 / KCTC 1655 / WB1) TaxID=931626 RepID=H6LDD0_ACEWD|nr:ParB/RepB/Spo0J family partition protein [Acetobacterium woodii]AFA47902.1 ParB-like partition protein [Acetobacterium woodii DSM 1030]
MDVKKDSFNSMFGSLDDLENNEMMVLDLDDLISFHDHIFTRYSEEMLQELMDSIEDVGLLVPILARDHPEIRGKFEILSGHNRVEACKRLGMKQVHARIFSNLTEDEAKLIVIETNLKQRNLDDFKPSERAAIVSARHNLMKKQGLRTDLIHEIESQKNEEKDGKNAPFHLGKSQIWRYTRIDEFLSDNLKMQLDDDKLKIKGAVELSYLEVDEQLAVDAYINSGSKITDSKAKVIRKKALDNVITKELLDELFAKKKKEVIKDKEIKIPVAMIERYFSESDEEDILTTVKIAIELYFKDNNLEKNHEQNEQEASLEQSNVESERLNQDLSLPIDDPFDNPGDGDQE